MFKTFKLIVGDDQSSCWSDFPTVTNEDTSNVSIDEKKTNIITSSIKQKVKKDVKISLLN